MSSSSTQVKSPEEVKEYMAAAARLLGEYRGYLADDVEEVNEVLRVCDEAQWVFVSRCEQMEERAHRLRGTSEGEAARRAAEQARDNLVTLKAHMNEVEALRGESLENLRVTDEIESGMAQLKGRVDRLMDLILNAR